MLQVNHGNYSFGMKILGENLARACLSLYYTRMNHLPLLQCLKFFDSQKIMGKVKEHMKYYDSKKHINIIYLQVLHIEE